MLESEERDEEERDEEVDEEKKDRERERRRRTTLDKGRGDDEGAAARGRRGR